MNIASLITYSMLDAHNCMCTVCVQLRTSVYTVDIYTVGVTVVTDLRPLLQISHKYCPGRRTECGRYTMISTTILITRPHFAFQL